MPIANIGQHNVLFLLVSFQTESKKSVMGESMNINLSCGRAGALQILEENVFSLSGLVSEIMYPL